MRCLLSSRTDFRQLLQYLCPRSMSPNLRYYPDRFPQAFPGRFKSFSANAHGGRKLNLYFLRETFNKNEYFFDSLKEGSGIEVTPSILSQ